MVVHGYDYLRDWIYVKDNVRAIFDLTTSKNRGSGTSLPASCIPCHRCCLG